jgi:hypothetical protein
LLLAPYFSQSTPSDYVGDLRVFQKSLDMKMYWSTRKAGKSKPLMVRSEKERDLPTTRKIENRNLMARWPSGP